MQRQVREVLCAAGGEELPLRELRRRLGEPDRSNLRRALRGLLEREIVEESCSEGERRVALTFFGSMGASGIVDSPEGLSASRTASREKGRATETGPKAGRRRLQATAGGPGWFGHEHRFERNRPLGETQRLVLRALRENAEPPQKGLPVTVVKAIAGADRSNYRRAVRTLLLRGLLEESEDGGRIRLPLAGALVASSLS